MPHKFTIHKRDGSFRNTKAYREYWKIAKDGTYQVEVKKVIKRTLLQNYINLLFLKESILM
jgi:hypothetical protein